MIDLNKYSTGFDKDKILPTGGFAQTDPLSSLPRPKPGSTPRDQQSIVAGYTNSQLGSQRGALRPRRFEPQTDAKPDSPANTRSRQQHNARPTPAVKPRFQEPPRRGYNPYA